MTKKKILFLVCLLVGLVPLYAQTTPPTPTPIPTPYQTPVCLPCLATMSFYGITIIDGIAGCSDYDNLPDAGEIIRCKIEGGSRNSCCTGAADVELYLTTPEDQAVYLGKTGTGFDTNFYFYIQPAVSCLETLDFYTSGYVLDSAPNPSSGAIATIYTYELETDLSGSGEVVCDTTNCEFTTTYGDFYLEAEACDTLVGTEIQKDYVTGWDPGDYIVFQSIDFKDAIETIEFFQRLQLTLSSNTTDNAGEFQLRLDSPIGEILAFITVPGTGSLYSFAQAETSLNYPANFSSSVPRIHDLFLVLASSNSSIFLDQLALLPDGDPPPNPRHPFPPPMPTPTPSLTPIIELIALSETIISDSGGSFCIEDDVLYISKYIHADSKYSIDIYDLSDLVAPMRMGSVVLEDGSIVDCLSQGNYLYLLTLTDGLFVIDVFDKNQPIVVNILPLEEVSTAMKLVGSYLYITNIYEGLIIVDITDPLNPQLAGNYMQNYVRQLDVIDNFLFLPFTDQGELHILDISDPLNPVLAGMLEGLESPYNIAVDGDALFLQHSHDAENNMNFFDITDRTDPQLVATFYDYSFWNVLYARNGLLFIDGCIMDPSRSLDSLKVTTFSDDAADLEVRGDTLFRYTRDGVFHIYTMYDTRQEYVLGDANLDGIINIVDALMTAQYYVGLLDLGMVTFHQAAADVNQNANIDIVDALIIAQYTVGIITDL